MKVEAFKIDGSYYISELSKQKIEISFYLVSKQIEGLFKKSGFSKKSGLTVSKIVCKQPTNAGIQTCKLITIKNHPFFIENFMQKTGLNFSEKSDFRVIHAPYLLKL